MTPVQLADNHVHTEWSWDAARIPMDASCRRAVELGLPSIAFTEHADWLRGQDAVVEIEGYFECIERCRAAYPGLRIMSGVEMGEPHLRAAAARGTVLELNTMRGRDPARFLCPGPVVLDWWREEGGRALSFGSDAHRPETIAAGFGLAQEVAAAAGFNPSDDPNGFWLR